MKRPRLELLTFAALAALLLAMAGCPAPPIRPTPAASGTGPLRILAANHPLQYFAGRIAGTAAVVTQPAPAGEDPADWHPLPAQIRTFIHECQKADLMLLNTPGYSRWLDWGSWAEARMVHTTGTFTDHLLRLEEPSQAGTHRHGNGTAHGHGEWAGTVWLDPQLALRQAQATAAALARLRPTQAAEFDANLRGLENDLQALHRDWTQLLQGHEELPLLASHPVYQYFQKRYRLNLRSVHWEPDQMPDEAQWAELEALRQKHPARLMLWEGTPLPAVGERLREMGIAVVVVSPGFAAPQKGDHLDLMRRNVAAMRAALSEP